MKTITKENNYSYLFFSLILFLFTASLMTVLKGNTGENIFSVLIVFVFIVSIKSLNTQTTWTRSIYGLILVFVFLSIIENFLSYQLRVYFTLLILLIFFIGSFVTNIKQVLFTGDIDGNKIIGSLTLYIILGLIWTIIYLLLLTIDVQSFTGIEAVVNWKMMFSHIAYYSFITLTTVGYGDIHPSSPLAEFFASMEAIAGVFYVATIVSSLISLRLAAMQNKKQEK